MSAVSAWEVAIKTRIGRLEGAPLLSAWNETLASMNAVGLVIDSADATMAGQLNWNHKDPCDRMIVTQAARRSFTIATERHTIDRRGAHARYQHSGRSPLKVPSFLETLVCAVGFAFKVGATAAPTPAGPPAEPNHPRPAVAEGFEPRASTPCRCVTRRCTDVWLRSGVKFS